MLLPEIPCQYLLNRIPTKIMLFEMPIRQILNLNDPGPMDMKNLLKFLGLLLIKLAQIRKDKINWIKKKLNYKLLDEMLYLNWYKTKFQ